MVENVKVDALLFWALKVRTRFAPWSLDNRVPYSCLRTGKIVFSFVTILIATPRDTRSVNRALKIKSAKKVTYETSYLYYMIAQTTVRAYGVIVVFRFVDGIWLHRKGRQSNFFTLMCVT